MHDATHQSPSRTALACAAAILAFVAACTLAPASSAAPPATEIVTKSGTLLTSNQNPFGAGNAASPGDQRYSLFDLNWNASGGGGSITNVDWHIGFDPTPDLCPGVPVDCDPYHGDDDGITIPVGDFGATATGNTQGEIGMSVGVNNFTGGSVGINYPVDAHFTQPAQDTFAPGATVAIDTSSSVDPSARIQRPSRPPRASRSTERSAFTRTRAAASVSSPASAARSSVSAFPTTAATRDRRPGTSSRSIYPVRRASTSS